MSDTTPKTLVQKLALASASVGGKLKADKKNLQDNYAYVSADKILSECGQALADQGISIIPSIKAKEIQMFDRGNGKFRYDATVDMLFKVTDGLTTFEETWFGMGSDYTVPDKAMYKAITSGHKYFVSKLFCIGEGNEDSEHDTAEDDGKKQPAQKPQAQPAAHAPVVTIPSTPIVEPLTAIAAAWPQDGKVSWEMAQTVTNSDGIAYVKLSRKDLGGRKIGIDRKLAKPETTDAERADCELKRDVIDTLLAIGAVI